MSNEKEQTVTKTENANNKNKYLSIFTKEGLEKAQSRIEPFLHKTPITPQAFGRAFVFACNRNPKLKNCAYDSIIKSFYFCAELALMPSFGQVWLIPRENRKNRALECTTQIGVRGWTTLLLRSPYVKNIIHSIVREKDDFELTMGSAPFVKHKIEPTASSRICGAYAIAVLSKENGDDHQLISYCSLAEIEHSRQCSASKDSKDSPWNNHYEQMALTVPLRRLGKTLALSLPSDSADNFADVGNNIAVPATAALLDAGEDEVPREEEVPQMEDESAEIKPETIAVADKLKHMQPRMVL